LSEFQQDGPERGAPGNPQRILLIAALFPPDIIGGAEITAFNVAQWLQRQGYVVGVLTTAKSRDEASDGEDVAGLKIWRIWMPRPYPMFHHAGARGWQKALWHLLDHVDPRNAAQVGHVLDAFAPDLVNIHILQGIGYNTLAEIGRRSIPTTFTLHDLGLACVRMSMYKDGVNCATQCSLCKVSAWFKLRQLQRIPNLRFCSPSRANLEKLQRYAPVQRWPSATILNPNRYPAPTLPWQKSAQVRLLFVGRLHPTKGIHMLLDIARRLAERHAFTLAIAGSGPSEAELRQRFADCAWCKFAGFVPEQEISNLLATSDLLCVPSMWAENSPGAIVHALLLGVPVLASDSGGIPELVEQGRNGILVESGNAAAWEQALGQLLTDPSMLVPMRNYALQSATRFSQDYLGSALLNFMRGQSDAEEPYATHELRVSS
jgi:glycosyltransferase involved in cell wall biosynthesis